MKKGITLGLVLCLCMVMLAGCGKQEQLQESEAAKTLVTTINERNLKLWKNEEYEFKEKERFSQDGELHEIYESNGITLSTALEEVPENEREIINTKLEIISLDNKVTKIVLSSKMGKDNDQSLSFNGVTLTMKEMYPDFNFKDEYGEISTRTYSPKS